MKKRIAIIIGAALVATGALAQETARRSQFPEGECSGVLCNLIGGSQAPQNQPRKSLFPEGQCGGVLCGAIGGSQAPKHAEAPPACGGGLLCDMAPYGMGQPFVTPEEAARRQAEATTAAPPAPQPIKTAPSRRKTKVHKRTPAPAN